MANMLDYLRKFGERTFAEMPFNSIDNLILSQLSYCEYDDVSRRLPLPLKELTGQVSYGIMEDNNKKLFRLTAGMPRFRESIAFDYVDELSENETKQFSAITFLLADGSAYVAFRGTDSTVTGWKEDLLLAFESPVPAQKRAREYLNNVALTLSCPLRVGGHSKGGNLAIYASSFCSPETRRRITDVYTNDGPGFTKEVLNDPGYKELSSRIHRLIPESSFIGVLMDSDTDCTIIDSDSVSIFQHNPYTWKTEGCRFIQKPTTTMSSKLLNNSFREWLRGLDSQKLRFLSDTVFDILGAGDARTLHDWRTNAASMVSSVQALNRLDPEDRKRAGELLSALLNAAKAEGSASISKRINELSARINDAFSKLRDDNGVSVQPPSEDKQKCDTE